MSEPEYVERDRFGFDIEKEKKYSGNHFSAQQIVIIILLTLMFFASFVGVVYQTRQLERVQAENDNLKATITILQTENDDLK